MPAPRLRPGDMRTRIEIRHPVVTNDGHGGQVRSWPDAADLSLYAEANSQNGREAVLAGTLQGVSSWRFRIWWRAGIGTTDQLRLDGRNLNIRSVEDPDGRREQLMIFADSEAVEG